MAFADGLELANGALAFAEHQNTELMGARGNQRISGVSVVAQGSPDMTVNIASGNVLAGGVVVAVSASATFAGIVAGGNVLFSTLQASLTSGQAVFVFIHVDSSGVITNTDGTPAVAGQQLPPDVPEDEVVLAMLTLTEGDTAIDNVDIEDWRINVPKGGYIAGPLQITGIPTFSGLGTSVGEGFLAHHTTGNAVTRRTFAQVLDDLGIGSGSIIEDLNGLTQATDTIPYFDSATTAALLNFLDEDDLSSNDALGLVSQQSIKAYVDTKLGKFAIPLFPNFRNSTGWGFISTDEYISATDDSTTDISFVYLNQPENHSLVGYRGQAHATHSSGGSVTCALNAVLEYITDGGSWTSDGSSFTDITTASVSGTNSSAVIERTVTPSSGWGTNKQWRIKFTKTKGGAGTGTADADVFHVFVQ